LLFIRCDILLYDLKQRLLAERESQNREHKSYKEAYDDLSNWLVRSRDKLPALKQQSLGDKLDIESALAPFQTLLNKQAQGELLVEQVTTTGRVAAASSSPQGQQIINNDVRAITENFHSLFKGFYHLFTFFFQQSFLSQI
jgi:nesprin-1